MKRAMRTKNMPPTEGRAMRVMRSVPRPVEVSTGELDILTERDMMRRSDAEFPAIREQKTRGALLHAPFIQFDEIEAEMRLMLPAQNAKVADSNTRWNVSGQPYRANTDQPPLLLNDLGIEDGEFEVKLTHLTEDREDCSYRLQAGMPPHGFRVFDAATGKERKLTESMDHTVELAPGTYLVVMDDSVEVQSDHEEEEVGDFRIVHFEAKPDSAPLRVQHEEQVWSLKMKVRPGLYITQLDEYRFQATRRKDGRAIKVIYGSAPDLTCAIPLDSQVIARLHFQTSAGDAINVHVLNSRGDQITNWEHIKIQRLEKIVAAMAAPRTYKMFTFGFPRPVEKLRKFSALHERPTFGSKPMMQTKHFMTIFRGIPKRKYLDVVLFVVKRNACGIGNGSALIVMHFLKKNELCFAGNGSESRKEVYGPYLQVHLNQIVDAIRTPSLNVLRDMCDKEKGGRGGTLVLSSRINGASRNSSGDRV